LKYGVTGGAGFIGSNIVKHLLEENHTVKVFDNLHVGKLENLEEIKNKIDFKKLDILDFDKLSNEMNDLDGIFHQAALTSVSESFLHKEEYTKVNVVGTENIFKIAQKFDVKVVFASSAAVFGNTTKIPITENFERNPINPYGSTKLEDELLAEKYSKSGSKIIGLRYFNVYGPRQNIDYAGVITKFLEKISNNHLPVIFGNGNQTRDFIFVTDVAKANLHAMKNTLESDFYNIGTGIDTSIKDLADMMIKISGLSLKPIYDKLPEGDILKSQADISKAITKLSWKPDIPLENGLKHFFLNSD
jgi:UDP-glucose 4-epimerase